MLKATFLSLFAMIAMAQATFATETRTSQQSFESVPGEYLVKIDRNKFPKSLSRGEISHQLGGFIRSEIASYDLVVLQRPAFERTEAAVEQLKNIPGVIYAEPNYIFRKQQTTDEHFAKQWGLQNLGQKDPSGKEGVTGIDVNAIEAWKIQTGSKNVIVAVIDTGVDYNNPDLKENMWTNEAELSGQPDIDDDGNGYVDDVYGFSFVNGKDYADPMDDHGHGSHCAGVIGARTNNQIGMAGLNWDVRIMAVKFLSKSGSGTLEDAVKAVDYSVKNGAHILSNSWGGGPFTQALLDAIKASDEAGALFVAAAGNNSANNDVSTAFPANYDVPNMVSVAAIDNKGLLANFSSFGRKKVHVGAPGVNVWSITMKGYESWSGTSMATPHVAGVAALVLAQDAALTNHQIRERVLSTAIRVPGLRNKVSTGGMVSAYTSLMNIPTPVDLNDPALWSQQETTWSTPHPYEKSSQLTYEVTIPGAKEIALYFEKFEIENRYDWLEVYNAEGVLVGKYTGSLDQSYSDPIPGEYAKLVFKSDGVINAYGIDLTKVAWR